MDVSEEPVLAMRNRIENAIRRENDVEPDETMMEEREEEQLYEDRDNTVSENPIDRMTWSSTASSGTTANYETE
jgi:hypothetical protein